jgi:pimeloyl-ACP methyl ester carboxylesterase/ribosomal protein S18 acetylase RimI-like enzyme
MALYDSVLARWPVPYEALNIPTRHGDTFVIASGAGSAPPLVLLHGAASNSAIWAGDVAEYSRHHRVYAVDLIGEPGKSAPNRPDWNGPAYAEWLADVFDALKLERATLIGISQGGWTALKFTTSKPERVEKLVLLCPGGVTPDRLSFVLRAVPLSLLGRWGAERITRSLFGNQPVPAEAGEFTNLILTHFKPRVGALPIFSDEELRRLTMPTLLLAGAQDALRDSERIAARMRALAPHLTATIIPEAGHALYNTTAYIMPFLADADCIIAPATVGDAKEILELQKLAYQSEAQIYQDYTVPPLTQTLEEIEADFERQLFLKASVNGQIVGSVRAYAQQETCFIGRLIVHPDYQNRGIGSQLMREIEKRFPQVKRYELFTGYRSERNLHLYQKLGYKIFRDERVSEKLTLVFLEKCVQQM